MFWNNVRFRLRVWHGMLAMYRVSVRVKFTVLVKCSVRVSVRF